MRLVFIGFFLYIYLMAYGTTTLTANAILSKLSEEQLIEYYLGIAVNYSKLFTNPLRGDDETPGCKFYISKTTGKIKFKDFAEGWDEDCFGIIMRKFSCNFPKALEIVAGDFRLFGYDNNNGSTPSIITNSNNVRKPRERSKITIRPRNWNKVDANFWKSFYLDSIDLKEANVVAVQLAWLNTGDGDRLVYEYKASDPCYAYIFPDKTVKLYFPFREEGRFLGNSQYIQGYNLLPKEGDHCILTKSYKDVLCMKKFKINSCAPQAESIIVKPELISELRQRFTNLYSLYDWDRAGIRGALRMEKEYGIPPLFFTRTGPVKVQYNFISKDFSDNLKQFGILDMIDIVEYTKSKIFNNIEDLEWVPF